MSKTTEAPEDDSLTLADAEWIATEATHRLVKVYREYGWRDCPRISAGAVRVVLEAARERATTQLEDGEEPEVSDAR